MAVVKLLTFVLSYGLHSGEVGLHQMSTNIDTSVYVVCMD